MLTLFSYNTDLSLIVDSQQTEVDRLSWESIEAFDHAQSGMEELVNAVKLQQDRKSNAYSVLSTLVVLMGVCYVISSFFSVEDNDDGAGSDGGIPSHGSPKFLTPTAP